VRAGLAQRGRVRAHSAWGGAGERRRFSSCVWAVLTEVHLCLACSCQEVLRVEAACQVRQRQTEVLEQRKLHALLEVLPPRLGRTDAAHLGRIRMALPPQPVPLPAAPPRRQLGQRADRDWGETRVSLHRGKSFTPGPGRLFTARGAAAVASFLVAVLTEIHLCGVRSCQAILRRNGRGQRGSSCARSRRRRRRRPLPSARRPRGRPSAARARRWSTWTRPRRLITASCLQVRCLVVAVKTRPLPPRGPRRILAVCAHVRVLVG
jgi:hypothetical protein